VGLGLGGVGVSLSTGGAFTGTAGVRSGRPTGRPVDGLTRRAFSIFFRQASEQCRCLLLTGVNPTSQHGHMGRFSHPRYLADWLVEKVMEIPCFLRLSEGTKRHSGR
jgi:hypothetical protein